MSLAVYLCIGKYLGFVAVICHVLVPDNTVHKGNRYAGGSLPCRLGLTAGLDRGCDALPQDKHGDLQGCHRRKTDPNHWHIPPAIHPGALTKIVGVPDKLPGKISHSDRGSQSRHRQTPEPTHPEGCWHTDGFWAYGPPHSLPSVLAGPAHEDVDLGDTGHSGVGKKWLPPGDRPAPLWNVGNKGRSELPLRLLAPVILDALSTVPICDGTPPHFAMVAYLGWT